MKKALVTGGAGFVAHHIVDYFLRNTDWEIVVLDRLDCSGTQSRLDEVLANHPKERKRVKFVWHDLKAPINSFTANDLGKDINYVYHLAASSHVDRSIANPMEFVMDNVVGTCNMLDFARLYCDNLELFVGFETDEVFGPAPNGVKYKEWDRYKSGNPYCLHPETELFTADGDVETIKTLSCKRRIFTKDHQNNIIPSVISNKFVYNSDFMYHLKLDVGNVKCTANHKFLVKRPKRFNNDCLDSEQDFLNLETVWVQAKDIQQGDWVAYARKLNITPLPSIYDNNECYVRFLGYFTGDGYIKSSHSLQYNKTQYTILLADQKKDFVEYYGQFIPNKGCLHKHKTKDCWFYQVGNIGFIKSLWDTGNITGHASQKSIPKSILLGNEKIIRNFLGGFFDADGCVGNNVISFSSASLKLRQQIKFMLYRLGIFSVIDNKENKVSITDSYSYNIFKKLIPTLKEIPEISTKPQRVFVDFTHVYHTVRNIDIEQYNAEVYDIEVPNTHNYVLLDGIISHNSASKCGAMELCVAYENTYKMPIINSMTMNVMGIRQHPEKFIPLCIRKILLGETIYIHSNKDKTEAGKRHYINTEDVADALLFLTNNFDSGDKYNIVGERELDNLTLAQMIADILGKPLKYEMVDFHSSRPGHDLRYALDGSKMKNMGWEPRKKINERLEEVVKWSLTNKKWIGM